MPQKDEPNAVQPLMEVSRIFQASCDQVYDAWLDPRSLGRWLFATPQGEMVRVETEPRPGGKLVIVEKRGETLAEHFGIYLELDRPRKLVFSFSTDRESEPTIVTVLFEAVPEGCKMTVSHPIAPKWANFKDRAQAGWSMILENLSGVLATGRELISSRFFDFPRELVFEAWKDPDHIIHWWGPNGFTNTFEEFDFRIGGHWRFVMHGPNGANFQNHIIFTDILEPEKIEFDHVSLPYFQVMVNFEESNGKTKVTFRQTFKTLEECQRLRSIAVPANEQNFDRLNAELTKMT